MKEESKIKIETEKQEHELTIQLGSSVKRDHPPIRSGHLDIDSRGWLIDAILTSLPKDSYSLRLSVKPDEDLVIPDVTELMKVSILGRTGSRIDDLRITSNRTDYCLFFYPEALKDCRIVQTDSPDNDCFVISYELALYHKDEKWTSVEGDIKLFLQRIDSVEPGFTFIPEKETVVYRRQTLQIGKLRVWNQGHLFRTPALNVVFSLDASLGQVPVNGLVSLGDTADVHRGRPVLNPRMRLRGGRRPNFARVGCCDGFKKDGDECRITNLCVDPPATAEEEDGIPHCFDIPVFLHMDKIENPYVDSDVVLNVTSRSCLYYLPMSGVLSSVRNEVGLIRLMKNTMITELDVSVDDGGEEVFHFRESGDSHLFNAEFFGWTGEEASYLTYQLSIANRAEDSDPGRRGAGVWFSGLSIGEPEPEDACSIDFKEGYTLKNGLFSNDSLKNGLFSKDSFPQEFRIFDGEASLDIEIRYTDAHIVRMMNADGVEVYSMTVKIPVEFDYWVDVDGSGAEGACPEYDHFNAVLRFRLYKRARPEWLCLDFGTSAIVASFSDRLDNDERLLPLEFIKKDLMARVFSGPDAERSREDAGESSVYLISSSAVLRDTNLAASLAGDPDRYGDKAVWLSPPSIGYAEYYNQLLPCLKSIVGNGKLPWEMIPVGIRRGLRPGGSVSVDDILQLVYSEFFHLFLPRDAKATERLIMSFPNTFSPLHISKIKDIAKRSLDSVRSDYLRFISESDAVAFYYNAHRNTFKAGLGDSARRMDDSFDSHVLVFDMGAGTLDLTYFLRENVPNNRGTTNTKISICGKLGVNKAGNYLDYVLATILVDILSKDPELEKMSEMLKHLVDISPNPDSLEVSMLDAVSLRTYVRDVVKLLLDKPASTKLPNSLRLFGMPIPQVTKITVGDLLSYGEDHSGKSRFYEFLESITKDIFGHFAHLFGEGEEKKLPVDLLIFSGRSTGLRCIRKAVKDSLGELALNPERCLFADLAAKRFVNVDDPVNDITGLKTAVVDGALAFCQGYNSFELVNRNVYATYGVLLKHYQGGTHWLPLIDYRTRPVSLPSVSRDGLTVCEYDTHVHRAASESTINPEFVDLSAYSEILLVQSYSKNTLDDWLENRTALISVLGGIMLDGDGVARLSRIRLTINTNNQLTFYIGNQPQLLLPHDNYEDETFAKSLWPVIRMNQ